MKVKLIVFVMEKILGLTGDGDGPRADMYLPNKLLAMSIFFLGAGTACGIFAAIQFALWAVLCTAALIIMGIFAFLCWRNQTIRIISDTHFTYTTMFGSQRTYAFSDIQSLRVHNDSQTLLVAGEKVHIEGMAILTDRLVYRINAALAKAANQ